MASDGSSRTPVALLAQQGDACQRLQEAISEAGGNLVLMADPNSLDVTALQASGAAVALVVLEPAVEDAIDDLTPALEATGVELMFEEADVVIARKSWDLQRWKRHLAAKLQGHHNVMPTGQEEDSSPPAPQASYASALASPSSASQPAQHYASSLDDFASDSDSDGDDLLGLGDLSASTDDLLIEDSLSSVSSDSLLDDLSDLAPDTDNVLQDSSSAFSDSAFDDFSFDDNDSTDTGGLSDLDLFAQDDLSLSGSNLSSSLDDLTDLAPDPSPQSSGLDSLSFSDAAGSSAFDDFSFDDTGADADSGLGLGELGELSALGDTSFDDLSAFSTDTDDDSLLDLASDSGALDSLSAGTGDLDIFPSALDDSDVLNLDDMLAPADQASSSLSSEMGIDESFSGFDSFESFSNDDLDENTDLSSLLETDSGMAGGGGGGSGDGSNVAVSVEELMALVSAAKEHTGEKDNKDKHSHLDNKQPQIGGPSGEFEKWGLADPDTVAEVIETKRNDPNLSDQPGKVFSAKDLSGVLGSLEARLEDMLDGGTDDLTIAFGGGGGSGLGGGSGQATNLHRGGGSGQGANPFHGSGKNNSGGGGSGGMARASAPSAHGQHQQRSAGDLGDPGRGSGPVVVLAGLSGVDGVRRLLGTLPAHFPYPVLVRLKMPTPRYANLAMQMSKATSLTVMLAEEGQSVSNTTVYILPDQMGLMLSGRQLYFSSGSGLLESLPEPGNAVVVFSGADPEYVPDVLNFVAHHGGWAGTQSRDNCFQPEAVNQLVAAGMPSGEPEAIGHLLIQRCGAAG